MQQEHVDIVIQGVESVNKWRAKHSKIDVLDLANTDLSGKSFAGIKFGPVSLENAQLAGATFDDCVLHEANLRNSKVQNSVFTKVQFDRAKLDDADFSHANFKDCNFAGAGIEGTGFAYAKFVRCHFSTKFIRADLANSQFINCNFEGGRFRECDVSQTRFHGTNLTQIRIERLLNVHTCKGLEDAVRAAEDGQNEGIESCEVPWHARLLGWERIRAVGKLPVFGISYFAIIAIPVGMYAIARYNHFVDFVVSVQQSTGGLDDGAFGSHISSPYHIQTPSQMLYALVSAIALAVASTLYHFVCPDRIKEFTREQWTNQLGKQLIQYLPYSWRHQSVRWLCIGLYAVGGTLGLWVLVTKMGRAAVFVWRNSEFPLSPF